MAPDEQVRSHGPLGEALAGTSYRFGPPAMVESCPAADRAVFSGRP